MTNPKKTPQIILLIFGILLLIIAFIIPTSSLPNAAFFGSLSQDLALVILTVVVLDFLWSILGGEPIKQVLCTLFDTLDEMKTSVKLLGESRDTGLQQVYAVSGALGAHSDWMNRLISAENTVDLMGYSLHVWTRGENFEDEIVKLAEKGVKIRILIMDEANNDFEAMLNTSQIKSISLEAAKEEVRIARNVFTSILDKIDNTAVAQNLEFRTLKNGLIVCQLCRIDSELSMVQYIYSTVASRSPLMIIHGQDTDLFNVYIKEFNCLWDLAEVKE